MGEISLVRGSYRVSVPEDVNYVDYMYDLEDALIETLTVGTTPRYDEIEKVLIGDFEVEDEFYGDMEIKRDLAELNELVPNIELTLKRFGEKGVGDSSEYRLRDSKLTIYQSAVAYDFIEEINF